MDNARAELPLTASDAPPVASFITWYPSCRRSDALAAALGGRSHLVHYFQFKQPRYAPLKYILQTLSSWRRLWHDRPRLVLVASPPVVAVVAVWAYCKLRRRPYVIDAHTGVFDDPRWAWAQPLARALSRAALTTIVTSEHLAGEVRSWGAHSLVIGTVPVDFSDAAPAELGAGKHLLVINTFSQDEPLGAVLAAAAERPGVNFHITGNVKHARGERSAAAVIDSAPANVRFTGWLSEDNYAALLRGVDGVMCLTTHDHTMQRGAYEAMAVSQAADYLATGKLLRDTFNARHAATSITRRPQICGGGNRPAVGASAVELSRRDARPGDAEPGARIRVQLRRLQPSGRAILIRPVIQPIRNNGKVICV